MIATVLSFAPSPATNTEGTELSIEDEINMKFETLNGTQLDLASFKGQTLILDLFATWCVPCEQQAQILRQFSTVHPDVTIISISVDPSYDTRERLTDYKNKTKIDWLFARDTIGQGDAMFDTSQLPTVVHIGTDGYQKNIKHSVAGFTELEGWVTGTTTDDQLFVLFGVEFNENIGLPLFFLVGLYIALSPCLFPVMPLTLFHVLGKQAKEKKEDQGGVDDQELVGEERQAEPDEYGVNRGQALGWVLHLWAGILFAFAIFALVGVAIGFLLVQYYIVLNLLFGMVVILVGVIMVVPKLEEQIFARIPVPQRVYGVMQKEEFGSADLFALGASYSIIALPCAGPAFIAILPLIIGSSSPLWTLGGLFLFAIGLLVPYFLLVMLTAEARVRFIRGVQSRYSYLRIATGVFLMLVGGLLAWPFFGGPSLFAL